MSRQFAILLNAETVNCWDVHGSIHYRVNRQDLLSCLPCMQGGCIYGNIIYRASDSAFARLPARLLYI